MNGLRCSMRCFNHQVPQLLPPDWHFYMGSGRVVIRKAISLGPRPVNIRGFSTSKRIPRAKGNHCESFEVPYRSKEGESRERGTSWNIFGTDELELLNPSSVGVPL